MAQRRNVFALVASAAVLTLTVGAAQSQTKWDMPTPYADREFHTINVRQFADDVKQATGGQLTITVHANGSLIKHSDILRAVSTGQVNIAEFFPGTFGNEDVMFDVDSLPFITGSYDSAAKLYAAHKPALEKSLERRNIRLLFSAPWPPQGIYTANALKSVDDFKGMKFRTYSPLQSRFAELLNASPTVIQPPEVPQAFATGAISGMMTAATTGVQTKAWEFVKHYYLTNASYPRNVVVVNERAFQRLPDNQKKALADAAAAAEKRGWEMSKEREKEGNETLAKNGITLHEPDPAMMAAFAKVGTTIIDEWLKKAGPDGEAVIRNFRAK
jgi:TRAP-type C4-dicarboxylate transport system substrate-binding protein